MVFSQYEFLLVFLPLAVGGYHFLLKRVSDRAALVWLVAASFAFYGYWSWTHLAFLVVLCLANAGLGLYLLHGHAARKWVLAFGIALNLGLLGYFKYFDFMVANANALLKLELAPHHVLLPLGMSFFVFQKIAFLVDAYRRSVASFTVAGFVLFVFFFPQLIAGPIVHHREMMPQFQDRLARRANLRAVALGLSILIVGLAKKVLVADTLADQASRVFDAAAVGTPVAFLEAWCGTVAYSLQLYFDFSGYCDMAIGIALLFGFRLPVNFNSPYKATSLVDFWRRWHITLSRFLRDYLYIPLGGNRHGAARHAATVFAVMLLGGLWHGAGWTFVLWGAVHGAGLAANHLWRHWRGRDAQTSQRRDLLSVGHLSTFFFVALAWVLFRAADLDAAAAMYRGLVGLNGVALPESYLGHLGALGQRLAAVGVAFAPAQLFGGVEQVLGLAALLAFVFIAPNTQQWFRFRGTARLRGAALAARRAGLVWRPNLPIGAAMAGLAVASLLLVARGGEFLYFQF